MVRLCSSDARWVKIERIAPIGLDAVAELSGNERGRNHHAAVTGDR